MPLLGSLFQLPEQLFVTATIGTGASSVHMETVSDAASGSASAPGSSTAPEPSSRRKWSEGGATCIACGIGVEGPGFESTAEQRAHFKSDWHRLNVKRRLAGQTPVPEQDFAQMLEQEHDEVGSISGSDSSSSEEEDDASRPWRGKQANTSVPQAAFTAADGSCFAVWRCLLTGAQGRAAEQLDATALLEELQRLRASPPPRVVVIMLRGGHFAAAVFNMTSSTAAAGAGGKGKAHANQIRVGEVLAHKTFHRYVVRAKAGGKQSTQDATGKFAKSAGSRLRRYNEAALQADVHGLLASWQYHLSSAHLIFVQAPGSNTRTIFPSEGAAISSADPRIRKIPFTTQRPTGAEVERVLRTLFSVYQLEQDPPQAGASVGEERSVESSQPVAAPQPTAEKSTAVSQPQDRSQGQPSTPPTEEPPGPSGPKAGEGMGELHKTARAGDAARVKQLLDSGLDPAMKDGKGKTAYALAANKDVRDAFRKFMAQHPDRWDYQAAGVPSPLTDEMEASQQAKKGSKAAKQKASKAARKPTNAQKQQKQAEAEALSFDEELARAATEAAAISARLNNASKGGKGGKGGRKAAPPPAPTPEDAAKRREMLAAAAEARMKALQLVSQQQKLWN